MQTNKHASGPWSIEHCRNDDGSPFISISGNGPTGTWLADIQPPSINGETPVIGPLQIANAHLIAAAPDLLCMLERVLDGVLRLPEIPRTLCSLDIEQARKAIAKAKGGA